MARNRGNNAPQKPQGEQKPSETKPDLQALAQAVTDATAALETAKTGGDAATTEAAEKALADAQAAFAAASTPPASADEAVAEVEAEVESFVDRLQQQIAAAEKAGNAQLHAWLLSLEGHLGSLKRHFETTHPQATAEIQALAEGIKSLF